jgi:phosphoglycerate dehydrogenase-like enzyme
LSIQGGIAILIYLNYYIDPQRWPRVLARLEGELLPLGFRCVNCLAAEDYPNVHLLVNRTRELTTEDIQRFPNLRGILLWGTEKWMLSFNETAFPVEVKLLDVDRGSDVAEHAVALLLAGLKGLHHRTPWRDLFSLRQLCHWCFPRTATECVGAHNWMNRQTGTLHRKRVGIVGYGLIGRQIHRRLQGFDCAFFYHHSRRYAARIEQRLGISCLSLKEMFARCDVVFVQLPLTKSTENLIGRDVLQGAKRGLALINCGRAAVINEEELYQALRAGWIGFYGADVFWREPAAPWNRFSRLPNVSITPHMAESVPKQPDVFAKIVEHIHVFCRRSQCKAAL